MSLHSDAELFTYTCSITSEAYCYKIKLFNLSLITCSNLPFNEDGQYFAILRLKKCPYRSCIKTKNEGINSLMTVCLTSSLPCFIIAYSIQDPSFFLLNSSYFLLISPKHSAISFYFSSADGLNSFTLITILL